MSAKVKLMPMPQKIENASGVFCLPGGGFSVCFAGVGELDQDRLSKAVAACGAFSVVVDGDADIVFEIVPDLDLPQEIRADVLGDAYVLEVSASGISVKAQSGAGLFYGAQTFMQLADSAGAIPCMKITDWPDMPFRGLHLTLGSGHMPTPEKLRELVTVMARYKLNHFAIEYDDRFPFERHPVLNHPSALPSKDFIRELIKLAQENYIEVIPLLDSLGHAQAYLVHPEYQHLAEIPDQTAEMCPSNPKTLEFIKELWEEILEVHEGCKYAHITGDEVFRLGSFCPECAKHAEAGTLSELFCNYYGDLSRWILERGRTPIIWSDMIIHYPQNAHLLPKELMINDWDYRGMKDENWRVSKLFGTGPIRHETYESLPNDIKERYGKYLLHESTVPEFTPFPCLRFLKDMGFRTIASSAASGEVGRFAVPSFTARISNNMHSAIAAKNSGVDGMLCTFWASFRNVLGSMHGVLAAAEFTWNARVESDAEFLESFQNVFLENEKVDLPQLACAMDKINVPADGYVKAVDSKAADIIGTQLSSLEPASGCEAIANDFTGIVKAAAVESAFVQRLEELCSRIDAVWIGSGSDAAVDLSAAANLNLDTCIAAAGMSLYDMGVGKKSCMGVDFEMLDPAGNDGNCVVGTCGGMAPDRPQALAVNVAKKFERLFFLHTSAYASVGKSVASYIVHFADGQSLDVPVVCGVNTGDWYRGGYGGTWALKDGMPGWEGRLYEDGGQEVIAYLAWWDNPRPDVAIDKVEMVSAGNKGYHVLLAMTGRCGLSVDSDVAKLDGFAGELAAFESEFSSVSSVLDKVYLPLMSEQDRVMGMDRQFMKKVPQMFENCRARLEAIRHFA